MKIPISKIKESSFQPRREYDNLQELADSIKNQGLINPITVRGIKFDDGGTTQYEVVAGHRRFKAVQLNKSKDIDCLVHELTDQQAREITFAENEQRDDVHPMQQAALLEEILKENSNLENAANILGEKRNRLGRMLALLNLSAHARKLYLAGIINSGHATVLSGLMKKDQSKLLEYSIRKDDNNKLHCVETAKNMRHWVMSNLFVELDDAAFDLTDATLISSAGTCIKCPHNTSCGVHLFEDVYEESICTKPKCFHDKHSKHVTILAEAFLEKHPDGVFNWHGYEAPVDTFMNVSVITATEYSNCKKTDEGSILVMTIGGNYRGRQDDVGKIKYMRKNSYGSYSTRSEIPVDETRIESMKRKLPRKWELRERKAHFKTREWMMEEIMNSNTPLSPIEIKKLINDLWHKWISNSSAIMAHYNGKDDKYKHGKYGSHNAPDFLHKKIKTLGDIIDFIRVAMAADLLDHYDTKSEYSKSELSNIAKELKIDPKPIFKDFNKESKEKKREEQSKLDDMEEAESGICVSLRLWTSQYCMGIYDDIPSIVLTGLQEYDQWDKWDDLNKFCRKLKVPTNENVHTMLAKMRIPVIEQAAKDTLVSDNPFNEDNLRNILGADLKKVKNAIKKSKSKTKAVPVGDTAST